MEPTDSGPEGTFLRLDCTACDQPDTWARCDACGRQALFRLHEGGFTCGCGASYDHVRCSCGAVVPPEQLVAVPLEEGPLVWSELEPDWARIGVLAVVALGGLSGLGWWLWG